MDDGAFSIGSLSIIGLPPTGFLEQMVHGLRSRRGGRPSSLESTCSDSILSIAYLMPIVARAFFFPPQETPHGDGHEDTHPVKESFYCAPPVITAVGCLVLFFAQDLHALLSNIQWGG